MRGKVSSIQTYRVEITVVMKAFLRVGSARPVQENRASRTFWGCIREAFTTMAVPCAPPASACLRARRLYLDRSGHELSGLHR